MKLGKMKAVLILFFIFVSVSISAQEKEKELGFRAQLEAQERQEHKNLLRRIQSMPNTEYKQFLNDRVDQRYQLGETKLTAKIVVDVTEDKNRPEPSYFKRLFTSVPQEDEYGVNRVHQIIDRSVLNNKAASISTPATKLKLTLKDQFQSQDKTKHFQKIEGVVDKETAKVLISQPDIIDLYFADNDQAHNGSFSTVHTPTGRIMPPRAEKNYDEEFLKTGFYQELMAVFETTEKSLVQVSFHLPYDADNPSPSAAEKRARDKDIDDFLGDWTDYSFKVLNKGGFYVLLITTKEHVEAMRYDNRVAMIKKGYL